MNTELYEKYLNLLYAAKGYIKDNYAESVQPENDYETDWFLSRIKYALYCLSHEKPVPEDCSLEILTKEFEESYVEYLEQSW